MLRSDLDQDHAEKVFSLENIIAGKFDEDLRQWAQGAKTFGSPVLIEWGTEPNGEWFAWNGKWNGGAKKGPERYVWHIGTSSILCARRARRSCNGFGT